MGKLEHYAELTKRLKERVINLEKDLRATKAFTAVDESTLQFAMSPTPSRVTEATYKRAYSILNMNTVKSRMVIRVHKIRLSDDTVLNKEVTTDVSVKKLTKRVNDILHKDITQSDNLDKRLYEILTNVYKVDPTALEPGKEYNGFKVSKNYKPGFDLAKNITFDKVSPGLASKIMEIPGTNPNTTGIASSTGNMNLQTWKDADSIEDAKERQAKQAKVQKMIAANPELYKAFEDIGKDPELLNDLEWLMAKSKTWQLAKKKAQDSDQVKENWTRIYVKGSEAYKSARDTGNLKAWDEFRRILQNPDRYDTDKLIDIVDKRIAEVLKKKKK